MKNDDAWLSSVVTSYELLTVFWRYNCQ